MSMVCSIHHLLSSVEMQVALWLAGAAAQPLNMWGTHSACVLQHAVLCPRRASEASTWCCGVQGSIPKVLDDIAALRPTLFCGVPRVYDRVYAGIYDQVCESLLPVCLVSQPWAVAQVWSIAAGT
jgi:hypothetical protein